MYMEQYICMWHLVNWEPVVPMSVAPLSIVEHFYKASSITSKEYFSQTVNIHVTGPVHVYVLHVDVDVWEYYLLIIFIIQLNS